jgi:hypothetical protein
MRCRSVVRSILSFLLLALMSACARPQYLSADMPGRLSLLHEPSNSRDAGRRYTSHAKGTLPSKLLALVLADTFSPHQSAQIARAVDEWNVVLNGFVRFEIMTEDAAAKSGTDEVWVIKAKQRTRAGLSSALAVVQSHPATSGGEIDIYVRRIGRRDLGGVVMHELGHALGLGHSDKSGLMSAEYHPARQRCIDKQTVEAVATQRELPLAQLNWCMDS